MHDTFIEYHDLLRDYEDLLAGDFRRGPASEPELRILRSRAVPERAAGPRPGDQDRAAALASLADEVRICRRCRLAEGRNSAVPGEGVLDPLVMVIGEGPGADEDKQGLPFVGAAGRFLDKWLAAIGLSRDTNAFIGNIVKCRPPGNRDPGPDESAACRIFLDRQIALVRPKTILALGRIASQNLLATTRGIGALRGQVYSYNGIPLVPTFHPSAVLRDMGLKRPVWEDLKRLKDEMEAST